MVSTLLMRMPAGTCDVAAKAWQAGNAGAAAVLVYDDARDPYTLVQRDGRE